MASIKEFMAIIRVVLIFWWLHKIMVNCSSAKLKYKSFFSLLYTKDWTLDYEYLDFFN